MPTRYTHKLASEGQSFPEFVMGCARAFGALITMRDDPQDAPIPESFEPSDFYKTSIAGAEANVSRLLAMSDDEKLTYGASEKFREIESLKASMAERQAENTRLQEMQGKVEKWSPPTPDHENLKRFMIEQITVSINGTDYYEEAIARLEAQSPKGIYLQHLEAAQKRVEQSRKSLEEEESRARGRTAWVKELSASIASES